MRRATFLLLLFACAGCGGLEGEPPARDFGETASGIGAAFCPGADTLEGIDVSSWQGGIDWNAVAGSGRAFAIARVSDGFHEDTDFDTNWAGIRNAGLIRGVYQFFRPGSDAIAQADILIRHVGSLGPGDLPPVIDVEVVDGVSAAGWRSQLHQWADHVQAALGRQPMIYVGGYFWDDNIGGNDFSGYPLWLPAYGSTCPRMPLAWSSWIIHQYSSTGSVRGISGNVDLDLFNGTQADLDGLAGISQCSAHCEGAILFGSDCGQGDCSAFGAGCVDDRLGPRCVFSLCPAIGDADVCLSESQLAHCHDGAVAEPGDCGAFAAYCSTAGTAGARCVSAFCVASAGDAPAAHQVCLPDGRIAHCNEQGGLEGAAECGAGSFCGDTKNGVGCTSALPLAEPDLDTFESAKLNVDQVSLPAAPLTRPPPGDPATPAQMDSGRMKGGCRCTQQDASAPLLLAPLALALLFIRPRRRR